MNKTMRAGEKRLPAQVKEELATSHSLLEAALDSTADGLLIVDCNGHISQFNRKFKELWHIPEAVLQEKVDQKAIAFVLDQLQDPQAFLEKVNFLYSHPEAESFDNLVFKDGRTFERYSQPQRLGEKIVGRVWSFRDITDRKKAAADLAKSEAELRALVEQIPAIMYTTSAEQPGKVIYISPQIETMTGYPPPDWLNSTNFWRKIVHPEDRDYLFAQDDPVAHPGEPFRAEYRLVKRDGGVIWVLDEAVLFNDKDGHPLFWQGIMHDISDKKLAEKLQRESEERFRQIFENMSSGVVVYEAVDGGEDFKITNFNRAAENIEKIDRQTIIGRLASQAFPGIKEFGLFEVIRRVWETGQPERFPIGFYKDERVSGWRENYLARLPSGEIVVVYDDVTARKKAEAELSSQTEELSRRNEELARLYRATGTLLSGSFLNTEEQAEKIVEVVQQEFGQDNCSLFIIPKEAKELIRLAVAGPYTDQVRNARLAMDGEGIVARALRTGEAINIPDVHADPEYVPNWEAAQSELAIPLNIGENVIGAIDVQSRRLNAFSPDDERIMSIFAERAALFLEHSHLNTQTEERIQQLVSLRTVDMAISGSFDINLTLGVLLDQVTLHLGVDAADILIFNPATQTFRFSCERGFRVQTLRHVQLKYGYGYAWRAIRERQAVNIPNINEGLEGLQRSPDLSSEHFVSYIGLPLIAKGQTRGILEVLHREPLRLEPDKYSFLEILAGQAAIAIDNAELFDNLQSSHSELSLAYEKTLEGWASALELRDHETEGHTRRTTELTIRLARAMGLKDNDIVNLYRGALLHDIGKMGVPDNIIRKPGPLTEEEWASMRKHPLYAYDMLSPISYLRLALDIPYCHHEKWDGSGYPRGLRGEQIPLAARIFAVVDVWDALTSERPYRKEWDPGVARQYIRDQAGVHFDPEVVRIFLREIKETRKANSPEISI
jgi:PAS domain S-box-containing protein